MTSKLESITVEIIALMIKNVYIEIKENLTAAKGK